ncbi:MAG TPA: NAD(P)/FAD-dependent oxidoreductase [Chloroflexota bacterium]|nr:NAD(P)/FAD-dependent oxidoreductase [Chloroflexota bacterium]
MSREYDAVIVGSGPNGLAAAVLLARAGRSVLVLEAGDTPGGGTRSAPLTLPGFTHDICSAVHPLGVASPFLRRLPLGKYGLEWVQPPAPLAHPFDDGTAVTQERSTRATAAQLGPDGAAWCWLMDPFVRRWRPLYAETLGPMIHWPRHPLLLARFGLRALWPTTLLARRVFRGEAARALFAGSAAHATLSFRRPPSAAFGLILGIAGHAVGWPVARGGSGQIARALVAYLQALGGELRTGCKVESLDELPPARAILLDVSARELLRLGGARLPTGYRQQLARFEYGLGTFKVDWALDAPIPWRAPACARAATVHLGGTLAEMDAGRQGEWAGRPAERPFVILAQPTLFDPTRAPPGKHTAWAYCHVPNGSPVDMTARIEAQVERFAPGFRDRILARHVISAPAFEEYNPNDVGGDINAGEATLRQMVFRPVVSLVPYATPLPNVFLCSASTPPGGAVHGMCGYHAARTALRRGL